MVTHITFYVNIDAKTGGAGPAAAGVVRRRIATDEALKIMHIERSELTPQLVEERFQKFFNANDPGKGGSFYLQSKIYRSKEALLQELNEVAKGNKDGEIPTNNTDAGGACAGAADHDAAADKK
jgi:import inner membrane translocase subunit TIM16